MTADVPERRRASDRARDSELTLLREDLSKLVDNSLDMTEKVGGLQQALESVAELQRGQSEIRRTTEDLVATSATRDELAAATAARRRAVRYLTWAVIGGVLSFLALIAVITFAAVEFHDQQSQLQATQAASKQIQYSNCLVRNSSSEGTHALLDAIIQAEQKSVDTATAKQLIAALQQAETQQGQVDCSRLLKS
jgi:hypothetical protein